MGARTDTRQRMVVSAAQLIQENGVARTSIPRVLEHSRGPRGSVRFHFPGGRNQLLTEALTWAGDHVTRQLRHAADARTPPIDVFGAVCDYYAAQLDESGFIAGCPVGAAAQEAYADPALGPAVNTIIEAWTHALADVLIAAGHEPDRAADLALLCVSSLEGAISMARVTKSTRPIALIRESIDPLLRVVPRDDAP